MTILKLILIAILEKFIAKRAFLALVLKASNLLPSGQIEDKETHPVLVKIYRKFLLVLRLYLNKLPASERQALSDGYLIPLVNTLFDKNYVNAAQLTLMALEEYFLSKKTETEFEEVLATFSSHAVAAGERFREKFPLPEGKSKAGAPKTIGFVAHFVAISGYEVLLGLGKHLKDFSPKMLALRVFDNLNGPSCKEIFSENGIEFILPKTENVWGQDYDVFALRKLLLDNPVDIALWPLPPFHMFFFFAFGLAPKQIWFSQYLRPNLQFKHLDDVMTPGGAGQVHKKTFNGREWDIIPQVAYIPGLVKSERKAGCKYLFTPARLEKLKQPEFMQCVAEILKRAPNTHFKWTGYYHDREVQAFFDNQGLRGRHTYLPWLQQDGLLHEIRQSDLILSCFPLSLGTVEYMAAYYNVPIVSMYDAECNLYWRDIYWEANNGNADLKSLCFDSQGNSKILLLHTAEDYIQAALRLLKDKELADTYTEIYKKTYDYTYHNNPNDIAGVVAQIFDGLYKN